MNDIKNISDFHKNQMATMMSLANPHFQEDNYDAIQPDRKEVIESDAEIMREQTRQEKAYDHSLT